jgi:hypothetical protein
VFHCGRTLFYMFVAAVLGLTALSAEDEPRRSKDESRQATVDAKETLVVKLQEGAKSPRAAISAFVAAANAGDVEATLLLIDPQFRPLVRTEVLLEEYIIERHLLRNLLMNDQQRMSPVNNLGAFPIVFAKRDLMRTSQIEVLKERPSNLGKDRVLLDVAWKVRSWDPFDQDHRFDHLMDTILAVRRQERWYLFHPFGSIFATLRNPSQDDDTDDKGVSEEKVVLKAERREEDDPQTPGTDYVVEYRVPIEVVHEQLVGAAQSPKVAKLLEEAQDLIRFQNGLRSKFLRGDFEALKDLDTALDEGNPVIEALVNRYMMRVEPAASRLLKKLNEQPAKE